MSPSKRKVNQVVSYAALPKNELVGAIVIDWRDSPRYKRRHFADRRPSPPLGEAVVDGNGFMTGEAQIDEPLLVQALSRLLQQLYLPAVVLDKLVICGKYPRDAMLGGKGRQVNWKITNNGHIDMRNSGPIRVAKQTMPLLGRI